MRKRGVFILFIVLISLPLSAQEISHKVLVPASSVASGGGYFISQTIGESAIELIGNGGFLFTQGFQQPSPASSLPDSGIGNGVKVYPNPVRNSLNLRFFGEKSNEYHVTIFGFNGAIYFKKDYPCVGNFDDTYPIDVSNYQRGIYFVKVVTEDGMISRLFKIEKM